MFNKGKVDKRENERGKNLRITKRDMEMLKFVLEMGQVSSEMLFERFYKYGEKENKTKYMQNRISRLKKAEYLNTFHTHDGPRKWICGTKKSRDLIWGEFDCSNMKLKVFEKIRLSQFRHDKSVAQIRVMLELGNNEISWREKELSSYNDKVFIPDGVFDLGTQVYYLELENVRKSYQYIRNKISNYFSSKSIKGATLLIVSHEATTLANYKKEVKERAKYRVEEYFSWMEEDHKFDCRSVSSLEVLSRKNKEYFDDLVPIRVIFLSFKDLERTYSSNGHKSIEVLIRSYQNQSEKVIFETFRHFSNDIENQIKKIKSHEIFKDIKEEYQENLSYLDLCKHHENRDKRDKEQKKLDEKKWYNF